MGTGERIASAGGGADAHVVASAFQFVNGEAGGGVAEGGGRVGAGGAFGVEELFEAGVEAEEGVAFAGEDGVVGGGGGAGVEEDEVGAGC